METRAGVLRTAFAVVMTAHALIHTFGFVKAFGLAAMGPLRMPISRPMGVVWLAASLLTIAAVVVLFAAPPWFWAVAIAAFVASQVAINYSVSETVVEPPSIAGLEGDRRGLELCLRDGTLSLELCLWWNSVSGTLSLELCLRDSCGTPLDRGSGG